MEKYFRVARNISRWKIDSPIERFLARMSDNSELWKRLYILYYALLDREYHTLGKQFIKKEINKHRSQIDNLSNGKESALIRDMEYCLHRFGVSFEEYFIYRFYDLNKTGRDKFNSLKLQYGYCEQFNSSTVAQICEDKYSTYTRFKKFFHRDLIIYNSPQSDNSIAMKFAAEKQKLIFKPLRGHSGQGIHLIDYKGITPPRFIT